MNILLRTSFSFCKEISNQEPQLFMAYFNIQSLFTNIPLDETIDICVDMVYNKRKKKLKVRSSVISNNF